MVIFVIDLKTYIDVKFCLNDLPIFLALLKTRKATKILLLPVLYIINYLTTFKNSVIIIF